MPLTRIALIVLTTVLPFTAAGAHAPADFSGRWEMAADRSESAHQAVPIGPVTLIVTQTDDEIAIETRRRGSQKGKIETEVLTYKLDGSETTVAAKDGTPVKSKAHWDGNKLVTGTARNVQGSTVTTLNVHTLDATGKELTIERTLTVQHGYQFEGSKSYGTGTDVFVKKAAPPK